VAGTHWPLDCFRVIALAKGGIMQPLRHIIALSMLVLLASASGPCLGAAFEVHGSLPKPQAETLHGCHHTEHPAEERGKAHDCPTDTLAKSSAPVIASIPALRCVEADALTALIKQMADAILAAATKFGAFPSIESEVFQNSWVFSTRAAMPPRAPSFLA